MRIRSDYVLRQVSDTWVVLPLGRAALDFNGMLTLNDPAVFLWRLLERGSDKESLILELAREYEVDQKRASEDIDDILSVLKEIGCLED